MLNLFVQPLLEFVQSEGALDQTTNLTLRAIERENGSGTLIFWTLLSIFALLVLSAFVISIWKAPEDVKSMFWKNPKGQAENLFLPVELHVTDPACQEACAAPSEKVYLRSLGFRKAVLLTEHPLDKGQEFWLTLRHLPYFHGKRDIIHVRLTSSRKIGEHWHINHARIIHEGRDADEDLSGFIRGLRTVPG